MFGTQRLFRMDRGATTSWLAGVTSAVLLAVITALPAVATLPGLAGGSTPVEQDAGSQVVHEEPEAILGEPLEDQVADATLDQSASDYEGVIGEPLEDEIGAAD